MQNIVGNRAKWRNTKRVFQENKAGQIFRKMNISYLLIRARTCAYHGVSNVRFWKILPTLFSCNTRFEIHFFAFRKIFLVLHSARCVNNYLKFCLLICYQLIFYVWLYLITTKRSEMLNRTLDPNIIVVKDFLFACGTLSTIGRTASSKELTPLFTNLILYVYRKLIFALAFRMIMAGYNFKKSSRV